MPPQHRGKSSRARRDARALLGSVEGLSAAQQSSARAPRLANRRHLRDLSWPRLAVSSAKNSSAGRGGGRARETARAWRPSPRTQEQAAAAKRTVPRPPSPDRPAALADFCSASATRSPPSTPCAPIEARMRRPKNAAPRLRPLNLYQCSFHRRHETPPAQVEALKKR